ncbi:MAG: hypothetical protein ABW223_10505 [Rariglobus sp.]
MNKAYFIAPLLALALFIGVYTWSQSGLKEREQVRRETAKAEQAAKIAADQEARRVAIDEALRVQEQRKKERAEREAREAAEREVRQAALDARDQAFREQERLGRQIERLKRETATEQEAVNKLQIDKDAVVAEQAFLQSLVPKARANAAALTSVLEKIAAAEAARIQQAAEDAKKKS